MLSDHSALIRAAAVLACVAVLLAVFSAMPQQAACRTYVNPTFQPGDPDEFEERSDGDGLGGGKPVLSENPGGTAGGSGAPCEDRPVALGGVRGRAWEREVFEVQIRLVLSTLTSVVLVW